MNLQNRTMFTADNLPILRGIDSESVDLIYLDPPFNSKRQWSAPIGSKAAGAEFKDTWTYDDIDDAWLGEIARTNEQLHAVIHTARLTGGKPNAAYLIYMAPRLLEMHRVLKDTGSLYLHCDPTMSHSLKLMMDAIFGAKNFRNEIIWCYHAGGATRRYFPKKHDCIYLYGKNARKSKHNILRIPYRDFYAYGKDAEKKGYHKEGKMLHDWWEISQISSVARERTGYPTQKPLELLKRLIRASSDKGDMVLDPFAGCATAAIAAEMLDRQWAGIDVSPKAIELVRHRYEREIGGLLGDLKVRTSPPRRSDAVQRSRNIKDILFGRQQGYCAGCGHFMEYRHLEVDHLVPLAKGGQDDDANLQLLCGHCNRVKGDRTMAYLRNELKKMRAQ